jgi:hypothetical protein
MRLRTYLRTGRPVAPLVAVLAALAILYGGGRAPIGEAYGVSAILLFPILAWQTKLLLDAEPDTQRRLARVALNSPERELTAGLVAALLAMVPVLVVAIGLPWLVGGVRGPEDPLEPSVAVGIASGFWAHLLAVPAALAVGALSCRAVTRTFGRGTAVLVGGVVATLVVQTRGSAVAWAGPPLLSVAHATASGPHTPTVVLLTADALMWAAVVLAGYVGLRRTRP